MRANADTRTRIIDEAIRRIEIEVSGCAPLRDALRCALEDVFDKAPLPLVTLIKIGRRRAIDRLAAKARRDVAKATRLAERTISPL